MKKLIYIKAFLNDSSLDVAFGAALVLLPLVIHQKAELGLIWPILLMLNTLVFYWLDHYLDIRQSNFYLLSNRHRFVLKYKRPLQFISLAIVVCNLICLFFLPVPKYSWSVPALVALLVYYLVSEFWFNPIKLSKEIIVSVIYATVITSIAMLLGNSSFKLINYIIITLSLALAVMQNMFMVNLFEHNTDHENKSRNMLLSIGMTWFSRLFFVLFLVQTALATYLLLYSIEVFYWVYLAIILFVAWVQQMLFIKRQNVWVKNNYRIIGEMAFWLAGLAVFFA